MDESFVDRSFKNMPLSNDLRAEDCDMLMRMYAAGLRGANLKERMYAFLEDHAT